MVLAYSTDVRAAHSHLLEEFVTQMDVVYLLTAKTFRLLPLTIHRKIVTAWC